MGDGTPMVEELEFAKDLGRKFRFDYAFPTAKVAVEVDGAVWSGGRHVRGKGFENDLVKMNLAQKLGWRVLRYSTGMLNRDPVGVLDEIKSLLQETHDANRRRDQGHRDEHGAGQGTV